MRILAGRWMEFDPADRSALEARLRQGLPRHLFPPDAFESEDEWCSMRDSSIFRRLKRIDAAGGALTPESHMLLSEISPRHSKWKASAGDRDDFHSWHEGARWGPAGHPDVLSEIADDGLVKEAMRLQREWYFEEGDIWHMFCAADPDRALRGLQLEADNGQWEATAWRDLLWAAADKGEPELQFELADLLSRRRMARSRNFCRQRRPGYGNVERSCHQPTAPAVRAFCTFGTFSPPPPIVNKNQTIPVQATMIFSRNR
jgi:hypothetical protein